MDNITVISVAGCFTAAVLVFLIGMMLRKWQAPPVWAEAPPLLPGGKVPVWFYKRLDLMGLVGISGFFFLMALSNSVVEAKPDEMKVSAVRLLVSIGIQFTLAGISAGVVLGRVGIVQWLGLKWRHWPLVFGIAPTAVLAMWAVFAGLYGLGYMDLMDKLGVEKVQETVQIFQKEKSPLVLGLMAFAAAIVAPICEETVFRGYLYPVAKRFSGPWAGALCTALVFGAAHGSLAALLPLCIFGLVLVGLYELTGSIWAPMAVHFLFNGATVAIQLAARSGLIPDTGI